MQMTQSEHPTVVEKQFPYKSRSIKRHTCALVSGFCGSVGMGKVKKMIASCQITSSLTQCRE